MHECWIPIQSELNFSKQSAIVSADLFFRPQSRKEGKNADNSRSFKKGYLGDRSHYRPLRVCGQPQKYSIRGYSVQIGAFGMRDNAERLAAELRSRYGRATVKESVVDGRRFYRVRVGNYTSLETAESALATLSRDGYGSGMVVAQE